MPSDLLNQSLLGGNACFLAHINAINACVCLCLLDLEL